MTVTLNDALAATVAPSAGEVDEAGNVLAGDYAVNFTTIQPDVTPPSVSWISPASGSSGVSVNAAINVTFNEAVDPATITTAAFTLSSGSATVWGVVTFSNYNRTVTLKPASQLALGAVYTATLNPGIKDVAGNATQSAYVSSFTTGSFSITSPVNNAFLIMGTTVYISAAASVSLSRVRFYVNGHIVGDVPAKPYSVDFAASSAASKTQLLITAEGIPSTGASIWAEPVTVIALDAAADEDNDGFDNATEVNAGTDPLMADAAADPDNDGLANAEEISLGTNPNNSDTDSDGLSDYDEVRVYGTNPLAADTDSDGLTDGAEVNTHHTLPLVADTDGDGLPDGWEVKYGLNPLLADSNYNGKPDGEEDPDADSLVNKYEYCAGLDPAKPATAGSSTNDKNRDSDGDGWTNTYELTTSHTNLCAADTDGDGVTDKDESVVLKTDPLNKADLYGVDLVLSGQTIRMDGTAYFNSLTLVNASKITASDPTVAHVAKVDIEVAGSINIEAGSSIDVIGRGIWGLISQVTIRTPAGPWAIRRSEGALTTAAGVTGGSAGFTAAAS